MARYVVRRLLNHAVLLTVAVCGVYLLAAWALNPYTTYTAMNPPLDPAVVETMLRGYNLSHQTPLLERFGTWLGGVVRGDWGVTPAGVAVSGQVAGRLALSLRLVLLGTLGGIVAGVAVGAWTASRQRRPSDRVLTLASWLILCSPAFVLGLVAQIVATRVNRWTGVQLFEFVGPSGTVGRYPLAGLVDQLQHLLLPTLVLVLVGAAGLSRIQRNLMLDALGTDYVRAARARGLTRAQAARRHALRTALIPLSTYVSFTVATMVVSAVYSERVFSFPGLGSYLVEALRAGDVNGVTAVSAVSGLCVAVGATLADVAVGLLDPRVRRERR